VVDEMDGFAISLVVGISIIFVGFLITNAGSAPPVQTLPEPLAWRAPPAVAAVGDPRDDQALAS
jgi:hypothetical protein